MVVLIAFFDTMVIPIWKKKDMSSGQGTFQTCTFLFLSVHFISHDSLSAVGAAPFSEDMK